MSYRKHIMPSDISPSELYKAVELGTNLAEVGTDCISRQAVKEILDKNQMPYHVYPYVWDAINALPPAQPERIKGRWVEKPHVHGVAYCSLCDYELHTNDTNFCPHCGADMREEKEK